MKRRTASIFLIATVTAVAVTAQDKTDIAATSDFVRDPDFYLSCIINVAGIALFVSRVHRPAAEASLGNSTKLFGIPALSLGVLDLARGTADFATIANFAYAAWALGATIVDDIFHVEYRDPRKPAVIIPYVVGYYIAIGVISAAQYENGYLPWAIVGTACVLNVAASFYARAKGAD